MPQTILTSYFATVGSAPPNFLPISTLQNLPKTNTILSPVSNAKPVCADPESNAGETVSIPLVRSSIPSSILSNGNLDYFIPHGQPHAAIVKVIPSYTSRLKSITSTLLPVRYPDKFFNECHEDEVIADLSRVLLWDSQPIGWIRCRLEENDNDCKQIYVQAIGILAPYRGCGLATSLIEQILQPAIVEKYNPSSIYCHVWESNCDAIEWYEKRGFRRIMLVEHYYRRLRPDGAWIMRKEIP